MAKITLNQPLATDRGPPLYSGTEFGDNWYDVLGNLNTMLTEVYGNSSTISSANRRGPVTQLSTQLSTFTSSNTGITQTMATYSLPAATLSTVGSGIYVEAWGKHAANASPVSQTLNVGGTNLSTGTYTTSGAAWSIDAYYFKDGTNTQRALLEGWAGSTRVASATATDTSIDTAAIAVSVTCLDASAATGNNLLFGLMVEFLP